MTLDSFITRLFFCLIAGVLFIATFKRLAITNPIEEAQKKDKNLHWLGWTFLAFAILQCTSFIFWCTKLYFPNQVVEPFIPLDGIIRSSSTHIIWGYANEIQRFCFTFFIGTFACLGFSLYFFKFISSPSKWWSKILKVFWYVIIWAVYVNCVDFHYFDFFEFIKTILFAIALIICFNRTTTPKKRKSKQTVPPTPRVYIAETEIVDASHKSISEETFTDVKHRNLSIDTVVDSPVVAQPSNVISMHYCRFCGNKIEADSKFCKYCGKPVGSKKDNLFHSVLNFYSSVKKRVISSYISIIQKTSKPLTNPRKYNFRKIFKIVGITLVSPLVIFGIGCAIWYYFDEIRPENRASEIFNEELSSLNRLTGNDLYGKCEDIIRNHNIAQSGKEYRDRDNLQELSNIAWEKLDALANNGNADAQFMLGLRYGGYDFILGDWDFYQFRDGEYRNQYININKSAYWYLKAAEQGHSTAQNNIGRYYETGRGVTENIKEALKWYRLSALNNNELGLLNLGDCFRDGVKEQNGTQWIKDPDCYYCKWTHKCEQHTYPTYSIILPYDIDSAKYYWQKSADLGNRVAKDRLQQVYETE